MTRAALVFSLAFVLKAYALPTDLSSLQINDPRCEMVSKPLGLDTRLPRLSWKLQDNQPTDRQQAQTAYRILVATTAEKLATDVGDLWDSGKVASDASILIPYAGVSLKENQICFWKVQAWDQNDKMTSWSDPAEWTMGLFANDSWKAKWIGMPSAKTDWTDYTIETHFTIIKGAASVYFRAHGPGNAYMWQIGVLDGKPIFKPHLRKDGGYEVLGIQPLNEIAPADFNDRHALTIKATGNTIETLLDGKQIDVRTDPTLNDGEVGFRESSDESVIFHDLCVTASSGKVLLKDNFKEGETIEGGQIGPNGLTVTGADVILHPSSGIAIQTPMLRREFSVSKPIRRAWLYASALGIYQAYLNGKQVGDQYFAPGWTNYKKTIEYQTYDVTTLLKQGANAIAAQLAPGWYAGNIAWFGPNHYGNTPGFLAELHVEYEDGTSGLAVATDGMWKASAGPVLSADILNGESYDANLEQSGWNLSGWDDSTWLSVVPVDPPHDAQLVSQVDPPVRVYKEFTPIEVTQPKSDVYIYKFPQDITGVARVKIQGIPGTKACVRYAEVLKADGTLDLKNMRPPGLPQFKADNTDTFVFGPSGEASFQPCYTWRGFQYIEVTGVTTKPLLEDVAGLSIGTDVPVLGQLETSDELVNRIYLNIFWSGRDAFVSYPMDCPQRCERLGWTGDANFYLKTAAYNFDMGRFYAKWERDLLDAQGSDGLMNNVSPAGWGKGSDGGYGGGWGDAGVCVPYELWRYYGDLRLVEQSYTGMSKWIDYLKSRATNFILSGNLAEAGDWQQQNDGTPSELCATAYFAYDVKLMAEMASALGKIAEAKGYRELFDQIAASFATKWIAQDGTVASGSQTAQILVLHIGLASDALRPAVVNRLVANVEKHGRQLTTGFVGTQWLLPVLGEANHSNLAYALLEQVKRPSWGSMVKLGSTTIWESWGSLNPDGSLNDGPNSLNHCALGSAGEWMYSGMAGISHELGDAGFKKIVIHPQIGGNLTHVVASYNSPYGPIKTSWKLTGDQFDLTVEIPPNTSARVYLPSSDPSQITESGHPISSSEGITLDGTDNGSVVLKIGSGSYNFAAQIHPDQ
jgi:alpha-L-rhamnosidase